MCKFRGLRNPPLALWCPPKTNFSDADSLCGGQVTGGRGTYAGSLCGGQVTEGRGTYAGSLCGGQVTEGRGTYVGSFPSQANINNFFYSFCFLVANVKCILTANIAIIGDTKFRLKFNVDKALKQITQNSRKIGSRHGSTLSVNSLSDSQKSFSSIPDSHQDAHQMLDTEPDKPKRFTVLVSNRYASEETSAPNEDCSYFNLEEVRMYPCTLNH